jgi:hypothetical protein
MTELNQISVYTNLILMATQHYVPASTATYYDDVIAKFPDLGPFPVVLVKSSKWMSCAVKTYIKIPEPLHKSETAGASISIVKSRLLQYMCSYFCS